MQIRLHKNAATPPMIRARIQGSRESSVALAKRFGVSAETIARWKKRNFVEDASHTPHRLQTTLNAGQEALVLLLREKLDLSLADRLAVTREFLHPDMSRSALHRMLKRHGVSTRPAREAPRPAHKPFKAYQPGYVHVDVKYLPQMADEPRRRYLFVAIDRPSRWVYVAVKPDKTARTAKSFLAALVKRAPFKIRKLFIDNGSEFTDRYPTGGERTPTGTRALDRLCTELGIEHRLTPTRHPQTNGRVERFHGRIADVLRTHHFQSGEELGATLMHYAWLHNHQLPQKALGHLAPIQALKQWQQTHPQLFHKRVTN
jgi:transposase InsO family protein